MRSDIIEKVKKAVSSTTRKAVKLSNDAIDYTKIKLKISELKSQLDDRYAEIGLAVYEGCGEDKIDAVCDEISALRQDIEELELRLGEYKNQKICPLCGAVCERDDEFCRKCGKEI